MAERSYEAVVMTRKAKKKNSIHIDHGTEMEPMSCS